MSLQTAHTLNAMGGWPLGRPFYPYPGWPYDAELERLRALERQAIVEEEKQRLRERLARRGIYPPFYVPAWPPVPYAPTMAPVTLDDVLRQVR